MPFTSSTGNYVPHASDDSTRLRVQLAWIITAVWIACFPLSVVIPRGNLIVYAQPPMMLVVGWLFAKPLLQRNGNDNNSKE
jgi:hypothetical protein